MKALIKLRNRGPNKPDDANKKQNDSIKKKCRMLLGLFPEISFHKMFE